MEACERTFSSICRLCLKQSKTESMVSFNAKPSPHSISYDKVLGSLTNISIDSNDMLPTKICQSCKQIIQSINSFKLMCQDNDETLQEFVNMAQNDRVKCMKMICEYALFCHIFSYESNTSPDSNSSKTVPKKETKKESTPKSLKIEHKQPSLDDYESCNESTENFPVENLDESECVDLFLGSIDEALTEKKLSKVKDQKGVKKKFYCNICGRTLSCQSTFNSHMQLHTKYNFMCDQCGRGFASKSSLNRHLVKNHDQGEAYQCNVCSFKCSRNFDLTEHIRVHTGERPFTCDKCGLTFRRKAIWRHHLKQHTEKTVACNLCKKKFHRKSGLDLHMNAAHERTCLYLCNVCDMSFAKNGTVRKHMLTKHGIPRDKQGKITRVTKESNSLLFSIKCNA